MFNSVLTFIGIFSLGAFIFYVGFAYVFPALHRLRVGSAEMPESWDRVLNEKVTGFLELGSEDQERVRKLLKVYMAEKFLEPKNMKWDMQIIICGYLAMAMYKKRNRYLGKLSTIKIGKSLNEGQGFLQVTAPEELLNVELKKWS